MIKTHFYNCHKKHNAQIVNFCGYALPINYGSQIKEHLIVRNDAGMFDVSHMHIIDIHGQSNIHEACDFLKFLLSNDIKKISTLNTSFYSLMLNENGGIIDDLIVYHLDDYYRIIANSSTKEKDLAWITKHAVNFNVLVKSRTDLSILAVQGPHAVSKIINAYPELCQPLQRLSKFHIYTHNNVFYAKTGYTGEDGLEIVIPNTEAESLWDNLVKEGVTPCGLGARDTLRLEAGMNLYGHDMTDKTSPMECGLSWVVDNKDEERNFIGKNAFINFKNNNDNHKTQIGVILDGKGVLREHQQIFINGQPVGMITSGTFSPSLEKSIGFACIAKNQPLDDSIATVNIRNSFEPITFTKLPFMIPKNTTNTLRIEGEIT